MQWASGMQFLMNLPQAGLHFTVNGIKSNFPESRDTSEKYKLMKSVVFKYVNNLYKYLKLCGKFLTENFIVAGKEGAKNNKVENRHTQLPGSL